MFGQFLSTGGRAAQQREASGKAKDPLATAANSILITNLGDADVDYAMAVNDALKAQFNGIVRPRRRQRREQGGRSTG